jgi:hypothetical protein
VARVVAPPGVIVETITKRISGKNSVEVTLCPCLLKREFTAPQSIMETHAVHGTHYDP